MKRNLGHDYISSFVSTEVSNTQVLIITRFGTDHKLNVQLFVTSCCHYGNEGYLMQIPSPPSRNIKHCAPLRGRDGLSKSR